MEHSVPNIFYTGNRSVSDVLRDLAIFTFSTQNLSRNIFLGSATAAMWIPHVSTDQM